MASRLSARSVLPKLDLFIGGKWRSSDQGGIVLDKFGGDEIAGVAHASRGDVAEAVACAKAAFERGAPPPYDLARSLERAAALVLAHKDRFISFMMAEAGLTAADAGGDLDRSIVTLRLCAEEATRIVGETVPFGSSPGQHNRLGFTLRVPLGVVCAITPFNSPLNVVLHKVGPALAAGNPVILKPSALTPLCSALLCELLVEAGIPADFIQLVHGEGETVGRWLLEEQDIAFYSFTGSTRVGLAIQRAAGLRRTQLELGSIASTLVCADADLDRAIPRIANAAFRKAGQVCTSTQRLYVQQSVFEEVVARLCSAAEKMPVGDPDVAGTLIGPMISEQAAGRASAWVEEAKLAQARIRIGGTQTGSVMVPTVITDARDGQKVIDQEIFAPVVSVLPFSDLDEALVGANNTPYGLSAGIFTQNINQALEAAKKLRFGAIHINETSSCRADAMPFGGVKASGFGHEGPRYAIRELTEERLVTFNV
jgi:succinate-semialdehyde dehydrogenase/glutarate-semialdehyde dehydrogenase